jgi:hypothetical protein
MQGQQIHTRGGRGIDGPAHGMRNIVKFQIKKNLEAHVFERREQVRAGQGEQFHAHFAPGDKTLQIPGQGQGRVFAGQIQGDDKLGH